MEPDPRFPNRPTHPDFERLSKAVITNDVEIEGWAHTDVAADAARYIDMLNRYADADSIRYMAAQRAALAMRSGAVDETLFATTWIDGFLAAARMFAGPQVQDGQHRAAWRPFAEPVEHPRD